MYISDTQDMTRDTQKKSKRKGRNKQEVMTVSQTEPEPEAVKTPIDLMRVSSNNAFVVFSPVFRCLAVIITFCFASCCSPYVVCTVGVFWLFVLLKSKWSFHNVLVKWDGVSFMQIQPLTRSAANKDTTKSVNSGFIRADFQWSNARFELARLRILPVQNHN